MKIHSWLKLGPKKFSEQKCLIFLKTQSFLPLLKTEWVIGIHRIKTTDVMVIMSLFEASLSPIPWLKILNSTYIFLFFYFPIDIFTFESRIFNQNLQIKMIPPLAKPTKLSQAQPMLGLEVEMLFW